MVLLPEAPYRHSLASDKSAPLYSDTNAHSSPGGPFASTKWRRQVAGRFSAPFALLKACPMSLYPDRVAVARATPCGLSSPPQAMHTDGGAALLGGGGGDEGERRGLTGRPVTPDT